MSTTVSRDRLTGLNPAQRDAVLHFEGPMLVLAGAGSGKTRVLTTRIAHLVDHHGVDPKHILAVTFTNKAAGEMRERIARLLGTEPVGMWCGTFHSVGARMLRTSANLVGRTPSFTIYDEDDAIGVIKRIMERLRISAKDHAPRAVLDAISDAKNALVTVGEYEAMARDPHSRAVAPVYKELEGTLRQANAVTFDDLLVLPVRVLEEHVHVRAQYQDRFRFILVDEYQDTNRAQYRFVKLIGGEHANVMVVGDDDQSIYGWRGADIRNILDFERDFPQAKIVRLEENYRSTPQILELANVAISPNTERRGKTLRSTRPGGERATVVGAYDDRDEADYIVEEIALRRGSPAGRASGQSFGAGLTLRDFAILYRTNAQSRSLEESLRRKGFAYRLVGAVRFYDRREIRDLMSYLKLIANPNDDEAFRRAIAVPKRGIGDTSIDTLAGAARAERIPLLAASVRPDLVAGLRPAARTALVEFAALINRLREAAREDSVDELHRDLIEAIQYGEHLKTEPDAQDRIENIGELIEGAAETVVDEGGEVGLTPLDHFLQRATLVTGVDTMDSQADAVTMMTMHNAKGLEFPVVFIAGMEDGLFPLARAFDDPPMLEEERRLFYVGITRAEQKLYITHARQRRRNGELMPSIPSSFLGVIPPGMLEERSTFKLRATGKSVMPHPSAATRRPGARVSFAADTEAEASQDAPRFVKGERVRHGRFGSGTIAELSGVGRDTKVTIDFDDESVGRKRLVVAYAGLERGWD
jgi:DNA helicase-2/ATP-dependent DNA helicase PcrA